MPDPLANLENLPDRVRLALARRLRALGSSVLDGDAGLLARYRSLGVTLDAEADERLRVVVEGAMLGAFTNDDIVAEREPAPTALAVALNRANAAAISYFGHHVNSRYHGGPQ